jgi:hypothetical protein
MATIELGPSTLTVRLHGWDPFYALRRTVQVPLTHIVKARARPPETDFDHAVRDPSVGVGRYVPKTMAIGTVELADGLAFFDVHDPMRPDRVLAIDLAHETFKHLVIDLDDEPPEEAVLRIDGAIFTAMRIHMARREA